MSSVSYTNNQVLARWLDADYGQKSSNSASAAPAAAVSESEMEAFSSDYLALVGFVGSVANATPTVIGCGAVAGFIMGTASMITAGKMPQLGNVTSTDFPLNGFNNTITVNTLGVNIISQVNDVNGNVNSLVNAGFQASKVADIAVGTNNTIISEPVFKDINFNVPTSVHSYSNSSSIAQDSERSIQNQLNDIVNKANKIKLLFNETKPFRIADLIKVADNTTAQNNTTVSMPKTHTFKPVFIAPPQAQKPGLNNTFTYKKDVVEVAKPVVSNPTTSKKEAINPFKSFKMPAVQKPIKHEKTIAQVVFNPTTSIKNAINPFKSFTMPTAQEPIEQEQTVSEVVFNPTTSKKDAINPFKSFTKPAVQELVKQEKTVSEMVFKSTEVELPVCKFKPLSELEKRITEVVSELHLLPLPKEVAFVEPSIEAHIETAEEVHEAWDRYQREQCETFRLSGDKKSIEQRGTPEFEKNAELYKLLDKKTTSLEAIEACHNHITYSPFIIKGYDVSFTRTEVCQNILEKTHYKLLEKDTSDLNSELAGMSIKLLSVNSALESENAKLQDQHTQNAETVAKLKKLLDASDLWENVGEDKVANLKNRISGIILELNPVKASEKSQIVDITPIVITDELRKGATKEDLKKCEANQSYFTPTLLLNERCWSKWFPKAVELKNAENFNLNIAVTNLKNELPNSQNALKSVNAQFKNAVIQNNEALEKLEKLSIGLQLLNDVDS